MSFIASLLRTNLFSIVTLYVGYSPRSPSNIIGSGRYSRGRLVMGGVLMPDSIASVGIDCSLEFFKRASTISSSSRTCVLYELIICYAYNRIAGVMRRIE